VARKTAKRRILQFIPYFKVIVGQTIGFCRLSIGPTQASALRG